MENKNKYNYRQKKYSYPFYKREMSKECIDFVKEAYICNEEIRLNQKILNFENNPSYRKFKYIDYV